MVSVENLKREARSLRGRKFSILYTPKIPNPYPGPGYRQSPSQFMKQREKLIAREIKLTAQIRKPVKGCNGILLCRVYRSLLEVVVRISFSTEVVDD